MSQVTDYGKQLLRKSVEDNWKYISVVNQADAEIFRAEVGVDTRATIIQDSVDNPVQVRVVVSGDDTEVTVSVTTVSGIKLYTQASGGTATVTSNITDFFFTSTDDELTINQTIEIPTI